MKHFIYIFLFFSLIAISVNSQCSPDALICNDACQNPYNLSVIARPTVYDYTLWYLETDYSSYYQCTHTLHINGTYTGSMSYESKSSNCDTAFMYNTTLNNILSECAIVTIKENLYMYCPSYNRFNRNINKTDCMLWDGNSYAQAIGNETELDYFDFTKSFFTSNQTFLPFSIEYRIFDYNTYQPIEGVNITLLGLNNNNFSAISDIHGIALIENIPYSYNFTVNTYKAGYTQYSVIRYYDTDTTEDIYLYPSTTEGIIRLTFSDLTLSEHKFCLYFTDNNRLQGCYSTNSNESVTIHNNINYTFIPLITKTDIVTNPENLLTFLPFLTPMMIGLLILVILIIFVIVVLIFIYNYMRNKK